MRTIFIAFALLAVASAAPQLITEGEMVSLWSQWKIQYNKDFVDQAEEDYRFTVFVKKLVISLN